MFQRIATGDYFLIFDGRKVGRVWRAPCGGWVYVHAGSVAYNLTRYETRRQAAESLLSDV